MIDEIDNSSTYENEHWGPPKKNERYDRVRNRNKYRQNVEEAQLGKDVNPGLARRFRKVYGDPATAVDRASRRRYKQRIAELNAED